MRRCKLQGVKRGIRIDRKLGAQMIGLAKDWILEAGWRTYMYDFEFCYLLVLLYNLYASTRYSLATCFILNRFAVFRSKSVMVELWIYLILHAGQSLGPGELAAPGGLNKIVS